MNVFLSRGRSPGLSRGSGYEDTAAVAVLLPLLLAAAAMGQSAVPKPPETAPATTTSAPAEEPKLDAELLAGLKFRSIGPGLMSGRIADIAVDPNDHSLWFVAVASGGVWKTANAGTTWTPVFDSQGSYSIGCVTLDPRNPSVVWVGTGENNSQRSVGFGDGVYRSRDGGASWENVGLKNSEHIGMIRVDPRDSDVVYVAAQGPLWRAGPERGLYKTTDGGESWMPILQISADTGINEVHLDPRYPDTLYASAYQRRRHVWTLINGGPESALYKSTDAGRTWRKITNGLPGVHLGRIGLGIAPANPDIVYAIVEAADGKGGFFRSLNRGETWEKRNDYATSSAQYYSEVVCDPVDPDHVYLLDTFLAESYDGGKTFRRVPLAGRHVDDHALWINPQNPLAMIVGCDGGLYQTFDRGQTWRFVPNLPVTQFYRVTADNSTPFYYVYGGTQDNSTLGGPSRTLDRMGIGNEHWFITVGGDGFKSQVDPVDPNIVYSQWQYGGLIRYDRQSGEQVDIKPREKPGEPPLRWNWDAPLILSPHNHKTLYFAANIVYRSTDQGNSWTAISPDLSRQLDRNQLPVMGKVWGADAVAKNHATSFYGNIIALAESPLVPGLLYVGTDDGLIQVTEDGGMTWRKIETLPDVPELTPVSCLLPSRHDDDTVYAACNNHQRGDFKPYLLKSTDRGRTWASVAGDLPARHFVWTIAEDHALAAMLFVGTEFGVHFTADGGAKWIRLSGGLPTIAVRDIDIQERENDLVLATFGRGIYILDDYSPLRLLGKEMLARSASLLPVKDALRYIPSSRLSGADGRGWQGSSFYTAPNPPFGATFTYYLKEKLQTRREKRKEEETKAEKEGRQAPYPTIEELRAEDEEREPIVLLLVEDTQGNVVRRVPGSREKGLHRVSWDLRYPASTPTELASGGERAPWDEPPSGPLALPGTYTVRLAREIDGELTYLTDRTSFQVIPLGQATFAAQNREQALAFKQKVARLQRAVRGALRVAGDTAERLRYVRQALLDTPGADPKLLLEAQRLENELKQLQTRLRGDQTRARRDEPTPPSVADRVENVMGGLLNVTSPPTRTQEDEYRHAGDEFRALLAALTRLIEQDLRQLEERLEAAGAPWTPGRVPRWEEE